MVASIAIAIMSNRSQYEDASSSQEREAVRDQHLQQLKRDLEEAERVKKAELAKNGGNQGAAGGVSEEGERSDSITGVSGKNQEEAIPYCQLYFGTSFIRL